MTNSVVFTADSGSSIDSTSTPASPTYSGNSVTVEGLETEITSSYTVYILEAKEVSSDDGSLVLPWVFSNLGTFYECYFASSHRTGVGVDRITLGTSLLPI